MQPIRPNPHKRGVKRMSIAGIAAGVSAQTHVSLGDGGQSWWKAGQIKLLVWALVAVARRISGQLYCDLGMMSDLQHPYNLRSDRVAVQSRVERNLQGLIEHNLPWLSSRRDTVHFEVLK